MLVRVADHAGDAGQRGNFFRSALRVATGDNNFAVRIGAMNAADRGTSILIRSGGNGAGVQNHELGIGGAGCALEPTIFELTLERGAISLCRPATEILDVKTGHRSIVT